MNHTVTIYNHGKKEQFTAADGTNLMEFIIEKGFHIDTPCGGNGTCGKCRVKVSGLKEAPGDNEMELLGRDLLEKGYVLACSHEINADLEIYKSGQVNEAVIMTEGRSRNIALDPLVKKKYAELSVPALEDQTPDLERVMKSAGLNGQFNDLSLINDLPDLLRSCDFKATAVSCGDRLLSVEAGDTTGRNYGMAVDIGTTTLAAYLIDLNTGRRIDVFSELNPQKKFGADVISRIEYTLESHANQREMQTVIVSCINNIAKHFAQKNKIDITDIYEIVLVGNTTMMHFLMGIFAGNIAKSPFITVTTALHYFNAGELGLKLGKSAQAILFPAVSGYIGADTVAAVLSSGMYNKKQISLLIDIGTNGEVVLGCSDWLYSCSTAAGPAFEGANIRNGIGGITGAIDKVQLVPEVKYTVIGNKKPVGICGSGILDAIAQMLEASVIDETGRIADEDEEQNMDDRLRCRLIKINGQKAFLLAGSSECGCDTDIAITQKDVRELQNAKAAIAAGIKTLAKRAGVRLQDIAKVYLAGGFGNYINVDSALKTGLLPAELAGRIESIGNAAGEGAVEGLQSVEMLKAAEEISKRIKYVELSASADFADEYVECMLF